MAIVSVHLAYQTWSDIGIVVLYREPTGIAVEAVRHLNRNTGDWHRGALADRSMVARPIAQSSRSCCAESDDSRYSSG